jgi:DNA helicase HerA-like ATPase
MGKTYLTNQLLLDYPRVILVSPIEAEDEEYHGMLFDDLEGMIDFLRQRDEKRSRQWRVKLSDVSRFPELCAFAYDLGYHVGGLMLAIEEAQRVIPARAPLDPEFQDILYRGRHPQVSVCMVAQRCSTISIEARSQWSRIITFRQTEPSDVNWISTTTGRPEADLLPSFKEREYFDITPRSLTHHIPSS